MTVDDKTLKEFTRVLADNPDNICRTLAPGVSYAIIGTNPLTKKRFYFKEEANKIRIISVERNCVAAYKENAQINGGRAYNIIENLIRFILP